MNHQIFVTTLKFLLTLFMLSIINCEFGNEISTDAPPSDTSATTTTPIDTTTEDDDSTPDSGVYGAFTISELSYLKYESTDSTVEVSGTVSGLLGSEYYSVGFENNSSGITHVTIDSSGKFSIDLNSNQSYFPYIIKNGRFHQSLVASTVEFSDDIVISMDEDGKFTLVSAPFTPDEDSEVYIVGDDVAGLDSELTLTGVTCEGFEVTDSTTGTDADHDGIPASADADKDGDCILDSLELNDELLATAPSASTSSVNVSGAYVFNNLKIDIDELFAGHTLDFNFNDDSILTLGWNEHPTETPTGYTVTSVEADAIPGWHLFGLTTVDADWKVAPGKATTNPPTYAGYPSSGSAWTGQLIQESSTSTLWEIFLHSPKDDGTLAALEPTKVASGGSIPLNYDFSGTSTGPATSNKVDYYRLKITYTDSSGATLVRYSTASSLFSYRTPALPTNVTIGSGSPTAITASCTACIGHSANPFIYPDTTTKGDIILDALPPKYAIGTSYSKILGTMNWNGHVFYYDINGQQIGSVHSISTAFNYTGAADASFTVPESSVVSSTATTDLNGDGTNDFFDSTTSGHDSSDIAAYKIDVTAQQASSNDNTGIFLYFVKESAEATFAGFN